MATNPAEPVDPGASDILEALQGAVQLILLTAAVLQVQNRRSRQLLDLRFRIHIMLLAYIFSAINGICNTTQTSRTSSSA